MIMVFYRAGIACSIIRVGMGNNTSVSKGVIVNVKGTVKRDKQYYTAYQ